MAEIIRKIGPAALLSCVILFSFGCETVAYTSTGGSMTNAELYRTVVDLERKVEELTREVAEMNQRMELLTGVSDTKGGDDTPLTEEEIIADESVIEGSEGESDVPGVNDAGPGKDVKVSDESTGGVESDGAPSADEAPTADEDDLYSGAPPAGDTTESMPTGDPQGLYDQALAHIMNNNPEEALVLFSRFVNEYSNHDLTDNAYYWLGESYYSLGDYESAVENFRIVTDSFSDRDKAPDAQLKLGYSLIELGEIDAAVDVLTDLINRYPESPVSDLARAKLSLL